MPSWPTAVGGMLMAGYAANQAQKIGLDSPSALVASALKSMGSDTGYSPSSSGRSSGGTELTVLQGEVDRLHKLLTDVVRGQKGGYTVIHTGRGGWTVYILPAAVAGSVLYVYVRVRGLSFSDLFMVTNKSLQQFRDLVSHSMTQLWEEMRKQKDEFLLRISAVGEQQQQMMAQQNQMDEKLRNVSANVEDIRDISNTIEARVGQMDQTINIMSTGVQRANEGIYLLCAAVAEVTRRVGMDNSRLKSYVQATPAEITDGNPGLRTLLEGFGSGDQSGALSATSSVSTGVITEVVEDAPMALGGEVGMAGRVNGNKGPALSEDIRLLYRRDSATSLSGRGLMGGLWGSSSVAAAPTSSNRSRAVANGH